ncbi:sensor histidine kinase [Paenibacillus cucumis (ex Kampfer et al. 2016)]|uniref:histidine kinase n=1 Tax=Paenibacillus cucumis (ex Kampfer et al. 2016) TaxID=1776858 RepID=A0ABS7KP94_9BACL|nr:histidine kinase [Paenibacillus cucumis (ex Kampfer et al. 2016)]MBY0205999.1 sensor histidine kinase [Paenibacillus cucumis (ex Kampfer et al. 2016)]
MPLGFLQYGLLVVPAVFFSLTLPLHGEALYTFYILISTLLAVANRFTRSGAQQSLLFLAEIMWASWLIALYGPFMIFISLSVLYVYMYRLGGSVRWFILGIQLITTNLALYWHVATPTTLSLRAMEVQMNTISWLSDSVKLSIGVNLLLWMTAALSWQGAKAANGRKQLEHVYDELRHKHYELQETRAQLLSFSKQLEDAAQAEERIRISRQLHDDIGHRLIRTKMMSEAALLTLPLNNEQGTEMVKQIRDQLAASMDDMRNTLHKLRPDFHASDAYALDRLLEEVGRDTGIQTHYEIIGQPHTLYPSTQIVLYKNAKEAVTNAIKHGKATSIRLQLAFGHQEIRMSISNDGSMHSLLDTSVTTGLGHEGMRQRTQFIGGTIEVQPTAPYTVITRIPITNKMNLL